MWKQTIGALRLLIVLTIVTGVLYPLAMTGVAQAVFPSQANGSLVYVDNLSSASGLDPDISPEGAYLQVPRVVRERHLSELTVRELIASQVQTRKVGLLGAPRVNVLSLNTALDQLTNK